MYLQQSHSQTRDTPESSKETSVAKASLYKDYWKNTIQSWAPGSGCMSFENKDYDYSWLYDA